MEDFIDQHRGFLVQEVTRVDPILVLLLEEDVITREDYDNVMSKPTSQSKMRELISHLNSSKSKDIFYKGLEKYERLLLHELWIGGVSSFYSEKSFSKPLLIPWLRTKIDSGTYPGVVWTNPERTEFSIPWKHALRQDSSSSDVLIFKAWAEVCSNGKAHGDSSVWKRNFRSALHAKGFKLVIDSKNDADNPHKVFRWPEEPPPDFIDHHRGFLVQEVTRVDPILDLLFREDVITREDYDNVMSKPTSQSKMEELISHLNSSKSKDIFYKGLEEYEWRLLQELRAKPSTSLSAAQPKGVSSFYSDFIDQHQSSLVQRVTRVDPILDLLIEEGVITREDYDNVMSKPTRQSKMEELISHLNSSKSKDIFYKGLEEYEWFLLHELYGGKPSTSLSAAQPKGVSSSVSGMGAGEVIRRNKTQLVHILMANIRFAIQLACGANLLVDREYRILKSISSPYIAATELVDIMLFKGETTCRAFLSLLQDTPLTYMFPELKTMTWYNPPPTVNDFIDQHQSSLVQRVTRVDPILDLLFREGVITKEDYDNVMSKPTSQSKMEELISHLNSSKSKDIFYKGLEEYEWILLQELGAKPSTSLSAAQQQGVSSSVSDSWSLVSTTTSDLPDAFKEEKPMKTEMQSVNSSSEEEEDGASGRRMELEMLKIESDEKELMKPDPDHVDNDEVYRRSCCERCQHVQQSYGSKKIIPEKLSRGRYQAQLEADGTYECVSTGMIFEASERVVVRYSVLPWSEFGGFVLDPWTIAGSTFDVETVPKDESALKSIQLPHCLCLAGVDKENVFGVLHITGEGPVIEPVEYSGSHLKWSVSSLSPMLPIARKTRKTPTVKYHGAVLIYKDLSSDDEILILRAYIAPDNSPSYAEDIHKDLLGCTKKHFGKVEKNASTSCPLVESTTYRLTSDPTGVQIDPKVHMFTLEGKLFSRAFFEVQYEEPPYNTFKLQLQLRPSGTDDEAWCATIRKGDLDNCTAVQRSTQSDLVCSTETKPSKRTLCKTQSEASEEERRKRRPLLEPGMTAKKLIIKQKSSLQAILEGEIKHVIQWVFEAGLLAEFQYNDLKSIPRPSLAATELLDKILSKGETTCKKFLSLLQEPKLTDVFPDLKTMPWYSSSPAAADMEEDR